MKITTALGLVAVATAAGWLAYSRDGKNARKNMMRSAGEAGNRLTRAFSKASYPTELASPEANPFPQHRSIPVGE